MLRLIIIEDELEVLSSLVRIINDYCSEVTIVGTASDFENAQKLIEVSKPDIALLDINLPDGNTIELLKSLPYIGFKVIFVTGYDEFALQAIKFSAIDYLLKPVDPTELIDAILQAVKYIENEKYNLKLESLFRNVGVLVNDQKVIVLRTSESIQIVEIRDIVRCESDNSYTTFYLIDGQKILISKPLKEYDELLNTLNFFRVHQSHLVNLKFVRKYEKNNGGHIVLRDGSQVPVSIRRKEALFSAIEALNYK